MCNFVHGKPSCCAYLSYFLCFDIHADGFSCDGLRLSDARHFTFRTFCTFRTLCLTTTHRFSFSLVSFLRASECVCV